MPGTYTARLTARNAAGSDTSFPGTTIRVSPYRVRVPEARFSVNRTSGYAPLAVQFLDTSKNNPTVWNWSFGDGQWFNTSQATIKNPVHVYLSPGTFTAHLTARNAAGSDTTRPGTTIRVSLLGVKPPVADFSVNRTSGYAPLAIQFIDTSKNSPAMWNWSFGDGQWFNTTQESLKNPSHTFPSPGSYLARLTVSNAAGKDTTDHGTAIKVSKR
jgi:PKD repeat protein